MAQLRTCLLYTSLFYEIEMPLVPVLVNIESNGVLLDTEALKQSSKHFTTQMEAIEQEIYQLAGEEFNIASPKQVGEVLFCLLYTSTTFSPFQITGADTR